MADARKWSECTLRDARLKALQLWKFGAKIFQGKIQNPPKILSPAEIARELGVSRQVIYKWIKTYEYLMGDEKDYIGSWKFESGKRGRRAQTESGKKRAERKRQNKMLKMSGVEIKRGRPVGWRK